MPPLFYKGRKMADRSILRQDQIDLIKDTVDDGLDVVTTGQFRLSALNTAPSAANDTGTTGEIRITADSIYVCVDTDTWVKATIATWS